MSEAGVVARDVWNRMWSGAARTRGAMLVLCTLLLPTAGCGSGDGDEVNPEVLLAVVEADFGGGISNIQTHIELLFGVETGAISPGKFRFAALADTDDGVVVGPVPGPNYATTRAALVDGVDSTVEISVYSSSSSSNAESSDLIQFLAADPGEVDLNGWLVERIVLECDTVSVASPGSDPNGNGMWTDYTFTGRVLIYGRRP